MPRKPIYTPESARQLIGSLAETNSRDYDSFMKQYKRFVTWVEHRLEKKDIDRLYRVMKQALIRTVELMPPNTSLSIEDIQDNSMRFYRAALKICTNKRNPWKQIVEGAGKVYVYKPQGHWNLRKIIEYLDAQNEEEFISRPKKRNKIYDAIRTHAGNIGKAAILSGMNYMELKPNERMSDEQAARYYSFSLDEIVSRVQEPSLDIEVQSRVFCNIFSGEDYSPSFKSTMRRETEPGEVFKTAKKTSFFGKRLEVMLEYCIGAADHFRIFFALRKDIKNRIHNSSIHFIGKNALADIKEYWRKIEAAAKRVRACLG